MPRNGRDGSVTYTPIKLGIKPTLICLGFVALGVWLFLSGMDHYHKVSDDQTFLQFRAVKMIFVGALSATFFGYALLARIASLYFKLPSLALNATGLEYKTLFGKLMIAEWNSLSDFKVHYTAKGRIQDIRASLTGPNVNATLKNDGKFSIAPQIFAANPNALYIELNRRRAVALGETFTPTEPPTVKTATVSVLSILKRTLFVIACFIGTTVAVIIIGITAQIAFQIPKEPYNHYIVPGALICGAIVAHVIRKRMRSGA